MSTAWIPPRRSYHLRVFVISLALVFIALLSFLFGVKLEAIRPAVGVVQARYVQQLRAPVAGTIELGWHDAEIKSSTGAGTGARLYSDGSGITDSATGSSVPVDQFRTPDGLEVAKISFHKMTAGDILWAGQPVARIEAVDLRSNIKKLEARVDDLQKDGRPNQETKAHLDQLKDELARGRVAGPGGHHWLVLKVLVDPGQAVKAGDLVAILVAADPQSGKPKDLIADLEISEVHAGDVAVGQAVRLFSNMFAQRLHGHADGKIERMDPVGEPGPTGERKFRAVAAITQSPFPLHLGSGLRAEIIIGKKQVYKIILEQ